MNIKSTQDTIQRQIVKYLDHIKLCVPFQQNCTGSIPTFSQVYLPKVKSLLILVSDGL